MSGEKKMSNIILVSGGFDPIHSGHIKLINDASKHGDVVVLLNSDEWLRNKKGKEFLPFSERKIIMQNIKGVIEVIEFNDSDKTCINGIQKAKSHFKNNIIKFANGGYRKNNTTPEKDFCDKNNIETLFGIGGDDKSNSIPKSVSMLFLSQKSFSGVVLFFLYPPLANLIILFLKCDFAF
jgi:D-beta-D-heptose 7-phosphate kinase/D-beta-D-heptose 1-phosphate adenosyltransferase